MDEQLLRLTTIQSRLDEQRQRAEELQRAGTSDLNLKVYDLRAEIAQLKETISVRDKQVTVLRNHLEQSKEVIDRQEGEISTLATRNLCDDSKTCCKSATEKLQRDLVAKELQVQQLRDKIRTEMITKVALPDLMETMLEDKSNEIEYLKTQLSARDKELSTVQATGSTLDLFARNVHQDISEHDHIRAIAKESMTLSLVRQHEFSVYFSPNFAYTWRHSILIIRNAHYLPMHTRRARTSFLKKRQFRWSMPNQSQNWQATRLVASI